MTFDPTEEFLFEAPVHPPPPAAGTESFPSIIDNSMVNDFRECEQRWFYKHCRKITSLDENVHLIAGGAYARGLEVTRKRYFDDGLPVEDAIRIGIRAAIVYYGTFEPHGKHVAKNIWRVIGAIEHHFNKWPINSRLRPFKMEGAAKHTIEFSFAKPIPGVEHPTTGEPLLYAGRYDFLGIDLDSNILGPVDDKTTTQLGEYWLQRWDLSSQMFGYVWATKDDFPELADMIQCAFIRGLSILKTKYGDADTRCYVRPEMLAKWLEGLQRSVRNMIAAWNRYKALDPQPMQMAWGGACTDFGGCAFKVLCETEKPELWIPVHFTKNTWNPLASRD